MEEEVRYLGDGGPVAFQQQDTLASTAIPIHGKRHE